MAYRCVYRIHVPRSQSPRPFGSDMSPPLNSILQEIAWNLGGTVAKCSHREYGFARVQINKFGSDRSSVDALFEGMGDEMEVRRTFFLIYFAMLLVRSPVADWGWILKVWMSHGDQISAPPPDFHIIGHTTSAPYAAIAHNAKPLYGIQFHPEVTHSPRGKEVISRFVRNVCGCKSNWTMVWINISTRWTFVIGTLHDTAVGGVYREGNCSHP